MKLARRAVTGEHPVTLGVHLKIGFDLFAALEAGAQRPVNRGCEAITRFRRIRGQIA